MLVPRPPLDDDIHNWLMEISARFGFPMSRITANHWRLSVKNPIADYILDIMSLDGWISYGVILMPDVVGTARDIFYAYLLELSAHLNGPHIGMQGNWLILTLEAEKRDLGPISFGQKIVLIDWAHQIVFPKMVTEAQRLGLKYNV